MPVPMSPKERIASALDHATELERLAYRITYDASPAQLEEARVVLRLSIGLRRKLTLLKEQE